MKVVPFRVALTLFCLPALLLVACGDDDPVSSGGEPTPFTSFPTLLGATAISGQTALKVLVPDGSGGWTDVTAQVAEVPCSDFFIDFETDLAGSDAPAIRFTSASEFAFVSQADPTTPLISGTYTRTEGDYTLSYELLGDDILYGKARDGAFYTPMLAVCNVTDDGSSRVEEGETMSITSTSVDLKGLGVFTGDTVVYQVFEVKYVKK